MSSKQSWTLASPQKRTKSSKVFSCAFCAFLWLFLLCGSVAAQSFLNDLQHRSFRYFWEQADPQTGLVPDRARMDGSLVPSSHENVASIAATGFGLTSLCIAADRGWISRAEALDRARMDGSLVPSSHENVASIAATGFGLTSLCIAADRGWISRAEALERTR